MSSELRKCAKCGGDLEDGFLWSQDSIGEHAIAQVARGGWMAGADFEHEKVGTWPLRVEVPANRRRTLTASRCVSCGLVELYAR